MSGDIQMRRNHYEYIKRYLIPQPGPNPMSLASRKIIYIYIKSIQIYSWLVWHIQALRSALKIPRLYTPRFFNTILDVWTCDKTLHSISVVYRLIQGQFAIYEIFLHSMADFIEIEDWLLINRVRGLYGKVFAWGYRTDRATKERGTYKQPKSKYYPVQIEQTRLISCLLHGF